MAKLWIKAEKMTKPKYAEAPFSQIIMDNQNYQKNI
jgi:hypothetical protein